MFEKWCYFLRFFIKRSNKQKCPSYITIKNFLPKKKNKYLSGTISLCHCRGHDCIRLMFYFDGFYEMDRRLFSENYYWIQQNMGSCLSKFKVKESNIEIVDRMLQGPDMII